MRKSCLEDFSLSTGFLLLFPSWLVGQMSGRSSASISSNSWKTLKSFVEFQLNSDIVSTPQLYCWWKLTLKPPAHLHTTSTMKPITNVNPKALVAPPLPLLNKIFTRFFCVYSTKVLIYSNFLWFYAESCSLRHECYCANTIISPTLSSIACLAPAWYMLMIVKLIARDIVDAVGKNIPSRACYLFKAFCWFGQLHGSTTSSHRRRRAGRQCPSEAA